MKYKTMITSCQLTTCEYHYNDVTTQLVDRYWSCIVSTAKNQTDKSVQKRMSGKKRRLEIARVAAGLFAAEGFSLSTRKISSEIGISQAALYKHFKSKAEIIEEVFRVFYLDEGVSYIFQRYDRNRDQTFSPRLL